MTDPLQFGFLVGRHLSETREKSAVNLGGIGKFISGLTGAANTASAAKPAVAAAGSAPKPMTIGPGSWAAPAVNQARAAAAANPHAQMPGGPIKMAPPLTARPAAQLPSPPPPKPAPGKITITPAEAAAGKAIPPAAAKPGDPDNWPGAFDPLPSQVRVNPALPRTAPPPPPPKPAPGKVTISPAEAAAGRAAIKITPQDVGATPAGNSQFARMMYENAESTGRNQMLGYGQRGGPSSVPRSWDQLTPEQQATVNRILGAQ